MPETGLGQKIYHDYRIVAFLPAVCVILDYAMTFFFAGDTSMITSWEASPFVRYAVIHDLMVPYLAGIVLFYYIASYAVLRILAGSVYYRFGVLLIAILSITHVVGGMSWYFRNAMYSNGVMLMSLASIIIAFLIFGFSLLNEGSKGAERKEG
jgi:hypothetical protein